MWIAKHTTKKAHSCKLPKQGDYPEGTGVYTNDVWECDDCKTHWIVIVEHDQREQPSTWFNWRRVEASNAQ